MPVIQIKKKQDPTEKERCEKRAQQASAAARIEKKTQTRKTRATDWGNSNGKGRQEPVFTRGKI